jgi:4-amino-4-deoxy-L-arabinose transferase-like glycosyltransferase
VTFQVVQDLINKSERYPLLRPSGYYPPLVPLLASPFYLVFGTSAKAAIMSNLIFIAVLVCSVYATATFMFDRTVGLLAAAILLLVPIVLEHSVLYYLDLPLTALVAISVAFLVRSDHFASTKYSVISGLCFGLGMLTKWTYLFFVLGPIGYSVLRAVGRARHHDDGSQRPTRLSKPLRNMALFVLTALLSFGPYYFPILPDLLHETLKSSSNDDSPALLSFASLSFYPVALYKDMITPLGVMLFALGLVLVVFSKHRQKAFLLVWLLIPYLVFTLLVQNKQSRYMMPWLLPISLTIAFGVVQIGSSKRFGRGPAPRKLAALLCLTLFVVLFVRASWRLRNDLEDESRADWRIGQIVSTIEEDMIRGGKAERASRVPVYMGVIPDHHYVNGQTVRYYTTLRRLPVNVIKLVKYGDTAAEEFVKQFDQYDYILTKSDWNKSHRAKSAKRMSPLQRSAAEMDAFFYSHVDRFECLGTFLEPDGSEVALFRKRDLL